MSRSWRWMILTTLGFAIGIPVGLIVGIPAEALVGMVLVTPLMTGISGAVLGLSQSVAIEKGVRWRWVLATAIGLGAGLASGVVAVEAIGTLILGERPSVVAIGMLGRALSFLVIGLFTGVCLGAAQGWQLRRTAVRIPTWIGACTLGVTGGLVAGSLLADLLVGGIASPLGVVIVLSVAGGALAGSTHGPVRALAQR